MNYKLSQYGYKAGDESASGFVTPLITVFKKKTGFSNSYFLTPNPPVGSTQSKYYKSLQPYYFYGVIKYKSSQQRINIKLVNYADDPDNADTKTQFVKSITVPASTSSEIQYYTVEFIFKPIANFDSLLFEAESGSSIKLGCIDISEINDIIKNNNYFGVKGSSLIRFSIQAIPGFLMCLNGEEIRVPRSGIYEVKNGIILIDSFAPVTHCEESTAFIEQKNSESNIAEINDNINQQRTFHSFTVDYLYYEIES